MKECRYSRNEVKDCHPPLAIPKDVRVRLVKGDHTGFEIEALRRVITYIYELVHGNTVGKPAVC
jgi:hypothetical protein